LHIKRIAKYEYEMQIRTLIILVICNAIWATNPAFGKILLETFAPTQGAWLRYGMALITWLLLAPFVRKHISVPQGKDIPWLCVIALATFFASPYLQYTGLHASTSTANTIIVAIEPLIALLMAWVLLGEIMTRLQLIAFSISLVGFCLLSNLYNVSGPLSNQSMGNILLLFVMPAEALYSVISRKLKDSTLSAIAIFGYALAIGFIVFSIFIARTVGFPDWSKFTWTHFWCLVWMGSVGTTLSYTYWTVALAEAPVGIVSLTLFVQPLLGATMGMLWLGEKLSVVQSTGAALILLALYLATKKERRAAALKT
jgi:drug/metabolite transporter (DMT)-like permease